ncbi:MAG: class I SAM-dependent methyltransferase [Mycobacteriales bacterium]
MTTSRWNPFTTAETAAAYAAARPDYHPLAQRTLVQLVGLRGPASVALDIGCGTGMSTRALRNIADRVIAVDASPAMLRAAQPIRGVVFVNGIAERLPVGTNTCDLAISAAAFHWFDAAPAYAELHRVLRAGGALAVYTDFFSGEIDDHPAFTDWLRTIYLANYPTPPRSPAFDAEQARAAGFEPVGDVDFENEFAMTAAHLADYMLTQSNATSALDRGAITRDDLRAWLLTQFRPLLPDSAAVTARFRGHVWCARKLLSSTG